MSLKNFKKKIDYLATFNLEKEIIEIVGQNHNILEDLLRLQLEEGFDADGRVFTLKRKGKLSTQYARFTEEHKHQFGVGLGRITDRITFYDTGAFFSEIKFKTYGLQFEAFSSVPYYNDIISKSGSGIRIMELKQEYLEFFRDEVIFPQVKSRFENHMNGF